MPTNIPEVNFNSNDTGNQYNGTIRQTKNPNIIQSVLADDEIVISGIAVRLPESDNMEEFKENLFKKIDMISLNNKRWPKGIFGVPERNGLIKDLSKFDASFFGVHPKQADVMDPQLRNYLELTHECIVDAGVNPVELRGQNIGVYMGASYNETFEMLSRNEDSSTGYVMTGCHTGMFANRVSFTFDFNGPSITSDTACSSSLVALQQAVFAMRTGQCESAIVGGSSCYLNPLHSQQYARLNMLSPDGTCKSFDESANGYVRSEAVVCMFVQKASIAKRNYSTIVHTKTNNDGYKEDGVTFPSGAMQKKLILEIYEEAGINPTQISYVEAHGTGTQAGDKQEIDCISDVFCKNRNEPLKIGSVKSNMGHSEPASGFCSIAKIIIAMEEGKIPPNLHFKNPNRNIPSLHDGRLQVISEVTDWEGGLAAVNSFGFGGSNAHVILRSNQKSKKEVIDINIPILVPVSGRTEEAVNILLDKANADHQDHEFVALLREITKQNIPGHNYRGYTTVNGDKKTREVERLETDKPPVWFVCSGMGSQYIGMGKTLLLFPVFAESILKSSEVLKSKDIDLYELILEGTETTFENVVNSTVAIICIQIALADLLSSINIQADGILGHSLGEVACSYIDGGITAEQAILVAYWRAKIVKDILTSSYSMAAIGLSFEEGKKRIPQDIEIACHNSSDNITVSGPTHSIQKFVEELKSENIFAREVACSGCPFHSSYVAPAAPIVTETLKKIIPEPKTRSNKWISSSIPEKKWDSELAKYSSVEYFVNNLLSPVLFEEALKKIPGNAIVLEIAPHCLLQALIKRSLPTCTNIGLLKRGNTDNAEFLLQALGKFYISGGSLNVAALYPKVKFPVSKGTPMIAPHIKWDHSVSWTVADFHKYGANKTGQSDIEINVNEEQNKCYLGSVIDGTAIFPAAGYLHLVWKAFAKKQNKSYEELPVIFDDVFFHKVTVLPKDGIIKFSVNILERTGDFEIIESDSLVVTGRITTPEDIENKFPPELDFTPPKTDLLPLMKNDIYKELRLRGYEYQDDFQSIIETDNFGLTGKLKWENNWISFIDSMLQLSFLSKENRSLYLPASFGKVIINPKKHLTSDTDNYVLDVIHDKYAKVVKSGGIEIQFIETHLVPRKQDQKTPCLEQYMYIDYMEKSTKSKETTYKILTDIILENTPRSNIKVLELYDESHSNVEPSANNIIDIIEGQPLLHVNYTIATKSVENVPNRSVLEQEGVSFLEMDLTKSDLDFSYDLIIAANFLNKPEVISNVIASVSDGGFVLFREAVEQNSFEREGLEIVAFQSTDEEMLFLYRKVEKSYSYKVINVTHEDYNWVEEMKAALSGTDNNETKILLVSRNSHISGIQGLINCLKLEPSGGDKFRSIFIMDQSFPTFSLEEKIYQQQLKKDLINNVVCCGKWGTFRYLPINYKQDLKTLKVEHACVSTLTSGDLSSLRWIESDLKYFNSEKHPGKELCSVYFASINVRDIMLASGKLSPENLATMNSALGIEFSGKTVNGKRVVGIIPGKGLATTVAADRYLLWYVPETWTLKEASTIPIAYTTAYYALIMRGRMRKGESILINFGSSVIGQAAISISLHMDCTVYITVESSEEQAFLKTLFPQLTDVNFANSHGANFQHVLRETKGKGVDIILNSFDEEKLTVSSRCLAENGRFLEIGNYNSSKNSSTGTLCKNVSFHSVLVESIFNASKEEKYELVKLVTNGIETGVVKPFPVTLFSHNHIEEAFRFMESNKQLGKVVLQIREEEKEITLPIRTTVPAIPKTYFHPEKVYIIVGLEGFGLELTNWMVTRGAAKIVLVSRSGIETGHQEYCVRIWREHGVNIVISKADVSNLEVTKQFLEESGKIGAVGGIYTLAGVTRDDFMENQTFENFKQICAPMVNGTLNLDVASRQLCPDLEYFVVFSRTSCGRGNPGQSNYGFANSIMERIIEDRKYQSYPGLAIQFGAIENFDAEQDTMSDTTGTHPQKITSCLSTLDMFLQQTYAVVASYILAEKHISKVDNNKKVNIVDSVANILGIKNTKTVHPKQTLGDLGMDSLMGIELKQMFEKDYELVLSIPDIRSLTITSLQEIAGSGKRAK